MKKYEIIYEVVEQYRVEVEAENEALAREGFENGDFDDNLIEKMSDIAPYEDWNFNKTIVDINQTEQSTIKRVLAYINSYTQFNAKKKI